MDIIPPTISHNSVYLSQTTHTQYPPLELDYPAILQRRSDSIDTKLDEMLPQEHRQFNTSCSMLSFDHSLNIDLNVSFLHDGNLFNQEELQGKTDSDTRNLQSPTHSNNLPHDSSALDGRAMFTFGGNYSDSIDERDYIRVADLPY